MSYRPFGIKSFLACVMAVLVASGATGGAVLADFDETATNSEGDYYFELPLNDESSGSEGNEEDNGGDTDSGDNGEGTDNGDNGDNGEDDNGESGSQESSDVTQPLESYDVTKYAEKLRKINEEQAELDKQIAATSKDVITEEIKQKNLEAQITVLNERMTALNEYITALEIEMATNKREMHEIEDEIEDGVEGLKKRIRALYLAGSDSYTTVILESQSFYDVLMRMELVKRVAKHDDELLDGLYELKAQHESKQAELDRQQQDYDARLKELESNRSDLDALYRSSEATMKELEVKQKFLEMSDKAFDQEKNQYESDLSGILRTPTGDTPRDEQVRATMVLADLKLEELHEALRQRLKDGGELGEYEPAYTFAWPVPGCYTITSGVGARWGSYHQGIDISASHGTPIRAAESGVVIRASQTCPHDYGKTGSCGCGGGYGNYVIIDHGNDFITLYGHMTQVNCQVGDQVKQGDCIGFVGSTGFSTGDHLHFEIRYQGYIVNPAYYVDVSILPSADQTTEKKYPGIETITAEEAAAQEQKAQEESGDDESSGSGE